MQNRTVLRNNSTTTADNRWVVPHSLYLAAKYNAHINVEICNQVSSIKYVYKYVYKGHDCVQAYMGSNATEQQDETKSFLYARYISVAETCWRILSFSIHKEFLSCQRLDIHLLGDCLIYYNENNHPSEVISRIIPENALTAWFKYNANNLDDEKAMSATYPNFCEKHTFHIESRSRFWSPRRAGFRGTIGGMYTVSPRDIEKCHLRILLLHAPGIKSFENLRIVNGQIYKSFQEAARNMGPLADDTEWSAAMTEAALTQSPSSLRKLFCILIAFSGVFDPYQLWLDHKASMTEDYLYRYQQDLRNINEPIFELSVEMFEHCLLDLNDILADHRYDLKTIEGFRSIFPNVDTRANRNTNHLKTYERMYALLYTQSLEAPDPDLLQFNESQSLVYNATRDAASQDNSQGLRIFFIDGPSGTGKTLVLNALLDCVRQSDNIAIAVASSGAAALLLKGRCTVHSIFKVPLEVTTITMSDMSPISNIVSFIQRLKLIVWNECSMIIKDLIETVDRSFRDIMKIDAPFCGCLMVLVEIFAKYP